MADDELDLTSGTESASSTRRRRRRSSEGGSSSGDSSSATDSQIKQRVNRVLGEIVKGRRASEDEELADAVEETTEQMAQGFVSLTDSFKPLRIPFIMFLNLIEPLMAFWRVGKILFNRFRQRRYDRAVENAATASGMTVEEYVAAGMPDPASVVQPNGNGEEQVQVG